MTTFITKTSPDYSLLDNNTGEILEYRQTKKLSLDEFIMVFFTSCPMLLKLKGFNLKVLICCWKFSSYNYENDKEGNIIHNNSSFKDYCRAEGLETSDASIDNAISQLKKNGFLIKKCKGEYMLNPKYFFKGTLSKRSKLQLNLVVESESAEAGIA